jgi:hypothetical protein
VNYRCVIHEVVFQLAGNHVLIYTRKMHPSVRVHNPWGGFDIQNTKVLIQISSRDRHAIEVKSKGPRIPVLSHNPVTIIRPSCLLRHTVINLGSASPYI